MMSSVEIMALAAKNEYIEAKIDQAVDIIMLAGCLEFVNHGVNRYRDRVAVGAELVLLLLKMDGKPLPIGFTFGDTELLYFQRALDIVNLPRILASASSGVVQGTKREG